MVYIDYDYMPSFNHSFNQSFAIGGIAYIDIPKTNEKQQE